MRIAILAPMRQELAPVVQAFDLSRTTIGDTVVQTGTVGDTEIVATTTGIGTAGARAATERVLELQPADHVMVVGIAGGVGPTVKIGDLIFAGTVVDKATGTEYQPTHLGSPAPTARGKIVTSDDFLIDPGMLDELIADDVIALDMETSAVAEVCVARGTDWSVIRAISDMATDHPDDAVLGLANPDGTANGAAVAKFLLTRPWRIPSLAKLQRGSKLAATAAARAAARACAPA
ncbi:MAG TPA: 5'-methylthioadenosine/S-adenosylhomocysteine nucleosidase [Acidimicrobiia bacterium]|jgi:adenosylhomocysteine nucleosidase